MVLPGVRRAPVFGRVLPALGSCVAKTVCSLVRFVSMLCFCLLGFWALLLDTGDCRGQYTTVRHQHLWHAPGQISLNSKCRLVRNDLRPALQPSTRTRGHPTIPTPPNTTYHHLNHLKEADRLISKPTPSSLQHSVILGWGFLNHSYPGFSS